MKDNIKELTKEIPKIMPTKEKYNTDIEWELINWNFTKCRAKYKGNKRANYTFFMVDYDLPKDYMRYDHILEMRNKGVVKTKYFHKEKEAKEFLDKITK